MRTATRPLASATPGPAPHRAALVPARGVAVPRRGRRHAARSGRRSGRLIGTVALVLVAVGGAVVLGQVFLSVAAPQAVATVTGPDAVPTPSELVATASCDGLFSTGVDLSWSGTGPSKGYEIWRGTGTGDRALVARVRGVHHEAFRDADLGVDTSYTYRVRAFDGPRVGGWSNVAEVATPFLCLT